MKSPISHSVVESPRWQSRRFRSTYRTEVDMGTKNKYFRRRGKRDVIYLQERHCGVSLNDCLGTTDEKIAEIRRREIHIAIERGEYELRKTSFRDAVSEVKSDLFLGKSESTKENYESFFKNHLIPWFGNARLPEIEDKDLVDFKRALESKGYSERTIKTAIWLVGAVLGKYNISLKVPKETYLKPEKVFERFLTVDELFEICKYLDGEAKAVVLVAAYSGLRKGDILSLKWCQFDWCSRFLKVKQQKTGHIVKIPLHAKLTEALDLVSRGIGDTPVFTIKQTPLFRRWDKARKAAGYEWARFHDLRHFYGSYLACNGVRREVIAKLLGHRDLASTARYARFDDQTLIEATETFVGKVSARI